MVVHVYYNRTRKLWSIKHKGKVIQHREALALSDCTWVVQPNGNERCRRTGKRDVHAYVKGTLENLFVFEKMEQGLAVPVTYNPFFHTQFMYKHLNSPVGDKTPGALFYPGGAARAVWHYEK